MNILIFNWHEEFISLLCKTGYNFFIFSPSLLGVAPVSRKSPFWNPEIPLPSNANLIINPYELKEYYPFSKEQACLFPTCNKEIPAQASVYSDTNKAGGKKYFDFACCFTTFDLELLLNFSIPKIFIPIVSFQNAIGQKSFDDKKKYELHFRYLLKLTKQAEVLYLNENLKDIKAGGYELDGKILNNKLFFEEFDTQASDKTKFRLEKEKEFLEEIKVYFSQYSEQSRLFTTKVATNNQISLNPNVIKENLTDITTKELGECEEKDTILWKGPVFSHHSLALVNREIALSLLDTNRTDLILNTREEDYFNFEELFYNHQDNQRLKQLEKIYEMPISKPPDFYIHHQWPPLFNPPPLFGYWVLFQPWEFGYIPVDWLDPLKYLVDEIWVYSNDNRETFIRSGISSDKVKVIPLGINPAIFYKPVGNSRDCSLLQTSKTFKFIYIGGMSPRKGADILIIAYLKAFTGKDDVCLVIKDYAKPCYGSSPIEQTIKDVNNNPDNPEIIYLGNNMQEEDIAGLLRACDCYVQPYRSEGFGLPIAEAGACGLPVIVTGLGSCLDFCNNETAYFIPATIEPLKETDINYGAGKFKTVDNPFWAKPDMEETIRLMRYVYAHQEEAKEKGEKAATFIHENFTWDNTAIKVLEKLKQLKTKPILRYHNAQIMNFLQEGKLNFDRNDLEKSMFYFEHVLNLEPHNPQALHALGCIYYTKKRYTQALDYIYRAWKYGLSINDAIAVAISILTDNGEQELVNKFKHLYEKQIIVWKSEEIFDMPPIKGSIQWKGEGESPALTQGNRNGYPYIDIYIQYVKSLEEVKLDIPASMNIVRLTGDKNTIQDLNFIGNLKIFEIWVLTEKQKQLYKENGIPDENLLVVPLFINVSIFHPYVSPADIEGKRKFNFLLVSKYPIACSGVKPNFLGPGLARRERSRPFPTTGAPLGDSYSGDFMQEEKTIFKLLDVYLKEFTSVDDISLILYLDAANTSYSDICEQISDHIDKNNPDNPNLADIILLEQDESLETVASIYAGIDCLITFATEPEADYGSLIAMAMKIDILCFDKNRPQQLRNVFETQDKSQIEEKYKLVMEKHNSDLIGKALESHLKTKQFEELFRQTREKIK